MKNIGFDRDPRILYDDPLDDEKLRTMYENSVKHKIALVDAPWIPNNGGPTAQVVLIPRDSWGRNDKDTPN